MAMATYADLEAGVILLEHGILFGGQTYCAAGDWIACEAVVASDVPRVGMPAAHLLVLCPKHLLECMLISFSTLCSSAC